MPKLRWLVLTVGLTASVLAVPAHAAPVIAPATDGIAASLLAPLPMAGLAPTVAQSLLPLDAATLAEVDAAAASRGQASDDGDLRTALIALAMRLRDIPYVRGGSSPSRGFDCSGFVRYVFAHAVGLELPTNAASQFLAGLKVRRGDMQPGDLVFFHTSGRKRISHVGIYIANGRFIHSPSAGKTVEVSSLDQAYWAKHFAGARRLEAIAQNG